MKNELLDLCNRVNEVAKKIAEYEAQLKKPLESKANIFTRLIVKAKQFIFNPPKEH